MLVKVSQKPYEDAQDMMMFALYHSNPKIFNKVMEGWKERGNINPYESGTGALFQIERIQEKYKGKGGCAN